jgi:hypothetical protein
MANDRRINTASSSRRSRFSLPINNPAMPRVDTSTAQYGPYSTAGAAPATSHSGPNSKTAWDSRPPAATNNSTDNTTREVIMVRKVSATWLRKLTRSAAWCSRGS